LMIMRKRKVRRETYANSLDTETVELPEPVDHHQDLKGSI